MMFEALEAFYIGLLLGLVWRATKSSAKSVGTRHARSSYQTKAATPARCRDVETLFRFSCHSIGTGNGGSWHADLNSNRRHRSAGRPHKQPIRHEPLKLFSSAGRALAAIG